jgi:predicted metal-dependent phosphotriesterase family hydrolase
MTFVRTVTGDIDTSELGVTYAHEHLVIDPGPVTAVASDFDLSDVDRMVPEVAAAHEAGLRAAVDAMPCATGRNAEKLADYTVYGGTPGLTWLLDGFTSVMEDAGIGAPDRHRLFVDNPARAFAFRTPDGGTA